VLRLARDVIDVAGPILWHARCLTAADLALITADCGSAHAAIIATRLRHQESSSHQAPSLHPAPQAGERPAETRTTGIAKDERAGPQAAELSELFFAAGDAERRHILMNLEYAAPASPRALSPRAHDIVGRLETSALAHNVDAFAREVELAFGISGRLARRIVADELGEPIVVVAKALQAPRAVVERILLFINPRIGQSVQRVYELATRYDEISSAAALRLVAIWQEAAPREQESTRQQQPLARRAAPDLARPAAPVAARRPLLQHDPRLRNLINR
jgi:uncharacterized protein (DUF2336 family)